MDSSRYAALFLTESRDNLGTVNQALLELERAPDHAEHIDALFRAVHTLKGMSGVMGYAAVGALAHELEALLAAVRGGQRTLAPSDVTLLFEASDALEAAIERSVSGDASGLDHARLVEKLRLAAGVTPRDTAVTRAGGVSLPPGPGLAVHITIDTDTPLRGARGLLVLQRARSIGEIALVSPDEASFGDEGFGGAFAFRLVTNASLADVERTLRAAGYIERLTIHESDSPLSADGPMTERPRETAWSTDRLKAPLQRYVRIDLQQLDSLMNLVGELVIARGRLAQETSRYADPALDELVSHTSRLVGELQDGILASRMVPVWQVFDRFPRVVRDAARDLGKEIELSIEGREIELDRSLLEQVGDPLVHLLRNSVDHGVETPEVRVRAGKARAGRLVLSASRDRSAVVIRITDDGGGIDRGAVLRRAKASGMVDDEKETLTDDEVLRLIARPGFSTAARVTSLSGRGVGIDAVVTRIRALGGSVELRSVTGVGTTFTLRLPVTLAIIPALLARVGSETYALPMTHIRETLQLTPEVRRRVRGRDVLLLRDEILGLRHLRGAIDLPARDVEGGQVVVLEVADRRAGLVVDQLLGQQEIVVKPFDAVRGAPSCFSGATILADGAPALILEVSSLF
jgi:two-component system, chemotaxis family, sensor kinase CheA